MMVQWSATPAWALLLMGAFALVLTLSQRGRTPLAWEGGHDGRAQGEARASPECHVAEDQKPPPRVLAEFVVAALAARSAAPAGEALPEAGSPVLRERGLRASREAQEAA